MAAVLDRSRFGTPGMFEREGLWIVAYPKTSGVLMRESPQAPEEPGEVLSIRISASVAGIA